MVFGAIFLNKRAVSRDLAYQFSEVVDSVSYSVKGQASVIIKAVQYDLTNPDWDFDHNRIQKGDFMIKKKNSMLIKLIKSDGQIILEGK